MSKAVKKFTAKWDEITGSNSTADYYLSSFFGVGLVDKIKEYLNSTGVNKHGATMVNPKLEIRKSIAGQYNYKFDKKRLSALGKLSENTFAVKYNDLLFNEAYLEDILTAIGPVVKVEQWHLEKDFLFPNGSKFHETAELLVFIDAEGECGFETRYDPESYEKDKEFDKCVVKSKEELELEEDLDDITKECKIDLDSIKQEPPIVVETIEDVLTKTFDPMAW